MIISNIVACTCLFSIFFPALSQRIDSLEAFQTDSNVSPDIADARNLSLIDSLNTLLLTKLGADRYPALYDLVFQYIERGHDKRALDAIRQARDAALLSGDCLWMAKSMSVEGQVLRRLERPEEALLILNTVMKICRRNNFLTERLSIANHIGTTYNLLSQFDKSFALLFRSMGIGKTGG